MAAPGPLIRRKRLRPVHPNAGIEAAYRRKMQALVDELHRSTLYWVRASYRKAEPTLAADEMPSETMRRAIRNLTHRWTPRFKEASEQLAKWFAQSINQRSTAALKKILKDGGIAIDFELSAAERDVVQATVHEQVALITTIPAQYFAKVEVSVMSAVARGGDVGQLVEELQARYKIDRKRAGFIARDQTNKATAVITRVRQIEAGITEAVWIHSHAGKTPRPSHVKAGRDQVRYDVRKGWYDPDEGRHIFPGELIGCRCVSGSYSPGFD